MNHWNHKSPETGWTSADGPTDKECVIAFLVVWVVIAVVWWLTH